jgi:hypothetical protein
VITDEVGEIELTPAASEKLDQNIDLVRQQILREISRQRRGQGQLARVSDVESVVHDIGFLDPASRPASPVAWLAVVLGCTSLGAELLSQLDRVGGAWLAGALALLTGVAAGLTLVTVMPMAKRRTATRSRSRREFRYAFSALEDDVRRHARELIGPAADSASLGRVISAVELLQLWTLEDSRSFRRLLGVRNSIVHEDSYVIPAQKLRTGFAQMTRLSSLLDNRTPLDPDLRTRRPRDARAALLFEERVINALRQADLDVNSTHGATGNDLSVRTAGSVTRVVVKFRKTGILAVADIADVVDKPEPGVNTIIVTNAAVSPYSRQYAQLANNGDSRRGTVSIVSWRDGHDAQALISAIRSGSAASETRGHPGSS